MFNDFQIWRIKSFFLRLPSALPGLTTFNHKIVPVALCVVLIILYMYICPQCEKFQTLKK